MTVKLMLLFAIGSVSTPALAQKSSLAFAPFVFTSDTLRADADSATLTVPMNRTARRSTATVTLPIVRFRSTASARSAPIIYLSGGSGSGIAAARGTRFSFFQSLREVGDVITFDLRGAGRSRPAIGCPKDAPIPLDAPMDYDALIALLSRNAAACADTLRRAGIDLAGFNLRETVEDIEAIRVALGVDKISLVGISTGSQIGLEYVRRHGSHVAHAVLAGVQGPTQMIDLPSEQETVLRELSDRLKAKTGADLLANIQTTFDSLTARPATVKVRDRRSGDSVTVSLGKLDAQLLVSATLGDRRQMQALPQVFGAAARGIYAPLASFKIEASRGGINSAFEALQDCQTGVTPERTAARAQEAGRSLLGWGTLDFPEHCAGWGVTQLDASWRKPVTSDASVLLISGTLDGRTSVANAVAVMKGLKHGHHLVVSGASHGDDLFLSSPEISPAIRAFLRGERVVASRLEVTP